MSTSIVIDVQPDEKVRLQLDAIGKMFLHTNATLIGLAFRYYGILCATEARCIDRIQCRCEVERLWSEIPAEMEEDVKLAFERIRQLPRRTPVCVA